MPIEHTTTEEFPLLLALLVKRQHLKVLRQKLTLHYDAIGVSTDMLWEKIVKMFGELCILYCLESQSQLSQVQ